MIDGLPWSVKGVEPDIRAEAQHAASGAGMTLGQWLNGVIRDSLVDIRAAHGEFMRGRRDLPLSSLQQEMAHPPMQHYPAQQPYPYAPMPQMMPQPMMAHPMMQPQMPMMQPQMMPPPYAMPAWPPQPMHDPVEARLRSYRGATETAVGSLPGSDQRLLSVIDAAVDAMQSNVRASEKKTAEALNALTTLVEKSRSTGARDTERPAPVVAPGADETARLLSELTERLAGLERQLGEARAPGADRRIEDRIGEALDSLARDIAAPSAPRMAEADPVAFSPSAPESAAARSEPTPGSVRLPPRAAAPQRPRPSAPPMSRGSAAIAEIAARQRALDADEAPQASATPEAAALDAIRRSIAALADQLREQRRAPQPEDQSGLRDELRQVQQALQNLAPRETVSSVSEQLQALGQKIEQVRCNGGRDAVLAPVEKLMAEMRAGLDSLRDPKALTAVGASLDALARRIEELGARSIDSRQIADMHRQLADMRAALTEARQHEPASGLHEQISLLGAKLDALAHAPRDTKIVAMVANAVDDMRQNLHRLDPDALFERISQSMPGLDSIEQRLDMLAERIETTRAPAADHRSLDAITSQIERMTQSLAGRAVQPDLGPVIARIDDLRNNMARQGSGQDLGPVISRIDDLAAKVARGTSQPSIDLSPLSARIDDLRERLAQGAPGPDLSALERRIADLQTAIQQRQPQPDIKGLEQILRKLAERIETVRAPAAGGVALDALQNQIVALAERLDQPGHAPAPALGGIERMLADLMQSVSGLREVAASAAESAVREAMVQAPMPGGMDDLAVEGMMLIKRDLTEMKAAQSDAEGRSRETLQMVSATLDKIVTRLSTLEGEIARPRAAAPAAAPVPQELAGNHDRIAPPLARQVTVTRQADRPLAGNAPPPPMMPPVHAAGGDDMDLPLEPGAGRSGTPLSAPGDAAEAPVDPRSNFIAAARRAAQAAAAQTAQTLSELDEKKGLKAGFDAKAGGVKSYIASRRKPLLLGLAALVFALGGLKVVSGLFGSEEPETTGAISAPALLPESAPASADAVPPARKAEAPATTPKAEAYERRLQVAEEVVAKSALPTMAMGKADPMAVGAIGAPQRPSEAGTAQPLPAPSGETGARPADVAALMKAAPYSANERLRQAAANGNHAAMYEIGNRLAEGRGTARDLKAAARWFEFAAERGFVPAQYRIGSFHREGLGVAKDAKIAYRWFQRAAEQGHILAMHNLAVLHAEGTISGQPDYAGAATWFRNAAEHGVKDSQFNIAILHVRGLGVEQNLVEAYKWFSAAAAQGDQDAVKKRDELATRMTPDLLAQGKAIFDGFRAKKPDMRANEVSVPDGGWDQTAKAPEAKKTRT